MKLKALIVLMILGVSVAACGDDDANNGDTNNGDPNVTTNNNTLDVPTDVVRSATLANVDGTPSATGAVSIRRGDDGTMFVYLGADFVQEMGPGDTEVRLAKADGNAADQLEADAASVSDPIGTVPNGASGEFLFEIPAGITQADFSHLIIWCPTAGVNFGVADLGGAAANAVTTLSATLANVDGTPSATGTVTITTDGGETTIALGDDFAQEMGPGDTELRLAMGDGNAGDQLAADANSVSDALGVITNGASGAQEFTVSGIDPSMYSHVIIWCPTAGVNFGVGAIQ